MKKILSGLALVLLAAGGTLYFMSDAILQRVTQAWLSKQMARQIELDGAFSVELGNPLRLKAEGVRLANPDWAADKTMATAAVVEAAIDVTTFLGDAPLILTELTIRDLQAGLVSNTEGQANWFFGDPDSSGSTNFRIRDLTVTKAELTLQRPELDLVDISIDSLDQTADERGLLSTQLLGTVNDQPVKANGLLGPFPNLLSGLDVRVALNATIGALQVKGFGEIDDLAAPKQPSLKLEISAPNAVEVAATFGMALEEPSDSIIDLKLDITPENNGVAIAGGGKWGTDDIDFKGQIDNLMELDGLKIQASGTGEDLQSSLMLFGIRDLPASPFSFDTDVSRDGRDLVVRKLDLMVGGFEFDLDGELTRFPSLNGANLTVKVKGEDVATFRETFGVPGVAQGEFYLEGELKRGPQGQDDFRLRLRTELGRATLFGSLGDGEKYAGTRASFHGEGDSLKRFAELLGLPGLKSKPFDLDVEVEAMVDGYKVLTGTGLRMGNSSLTATGALGDEPLSQGTTLDWELKGVDIADVARIARLGVDFPSRPIDARGNVKVRPADYVFSRTTGNIGPAEFTVDGQVGRAEKLRGTDLRVSLRGPKLEQLEFLAGGANLPAGPFSLSARVQRTARGVQISDSVIDVANAKGKADIDLALPASPLNAKFDVEIEGPDVTAIWEARYGIKFRPQKFVIDVRGEIDEQTWQLDDGRITVGQTQVNVAGTIRDGNGKLSVQGSSPEISKIGTFMDIAPLPDRRLDFSGIVERTGKSIHLENFLARTNKGDLAGKIAYTPGSPPRIDAEITSTKLDVTWLTDPVQQELLYDRPTREANERDDGRLIPDWNLPMAALKQYDMDLSISADEIVRENRDIRNAYLRVIVDEGSLSVAPWKFSGNSGTLNAELRVMPVADGADVSLTLDAKDLVTEIFVTGQDEIDFTALPKGDWIVNLTASGKSLRELFGDLDGQARLVTSSGKLVNSATKTAIFGDLLGNITSAVNPEKENETYTNISCAVFPFDFDDGEMETTPSIVVQTDKLNILSRGSIDLENEELDLNFTSKPRKGIGISAGSVVNPFVRIGGTMANPKITLDKGGAALSAGAAILTMGLSVLAKAAFDAAWRSPDPCGRVIEEAEKRFAKANSKEKKK